MAIECPYRELFIFIFKFAKYLLVVAIILDIKNTLKLTLYCGFKFLKYLNFIRCRICVYDHLYSLIQTKIEVVKVARFRYWWTP